jgi:hypothetical protein
MFGTRTISDVLRRRVDSHVLPAALRRPFEEQFPGRAGARAATPLSLLEPLLN